MLERSRVAGEVSPAQGELGADLGIIKSRDRVSMPGLCTVAVNVSTAQVELSTGFWLILPQHSLRTLLRGGGNFTDFW